MSEGNFHPLSAGLHIVEDPNHPQLYLMAEPAEFTEDPEHSQLYQIGS